MEYQCKTYQIVTHITRRDFSRFTIDGRKEFEFARYFPSSDQRPIIGKCTNDMMPVEGLHISGKGTRSKAYRRWTSPTTTDLEEHWRGHRVRLVTGENACHLCDDDIEYARD